MRDAECRAEDRTGALHVGALELNLEPWLTQQNGGGCRDHGRVHTMQPQGARFDVAQRRQRRPAGRGLGGSACAPASRPPDPTRRHGRPRRRPEFGHHAAVRRHSDAFSGFDPTDAATQIVFQFADACGDHTTITATCGHIGNSVASATKEALPVHEHGIATFRSRALFVESGRRATARTGCWQPGRR